MSNLEGEVDYDFLGGKCCGTCENRSLKMDFYNEGLIVKYKLLPWCYEVNEKVDVVGFCGKYKRETSLL